MFSSSKMFELNLIVTLLAMMESIQCLEVSSKIAFEPLASSSLTSYETSKQAISQQLNLLSQMDDILKPPKLEGDQLNISGDLMNEIPAKCLTNDPPPSKKKFKKCENGLCDFSKTTTLDDSGNLITTIKFSIVTKASGVGDIPVIDGVRGILPERNTPLDFPRLPNFSQGHKLAPRPSFAASAPKNHFPRPSENYYPHYYDTNQYGGSIDSHRTNHEQNTWMTGRDFIEIDDKIKSPFSRTSNNNNN